MFSPNKKHLQLIIVYDYNNIKVLKLSPLKECWLNWPPFFSRETTLRIAFASLEIYQPRFENLLEIDCSA